MPSAIKFTIGADSSPFAREMRKLEGQAVAASASIARARRLVHQREVVEYNEKQAEKQSQATIYRERQTAEQVEQARRNIKARSILKERAAIRSARINEQISGGSVPEAWTQQRTMMASHMKRARGVGGASSAMFVSVARDTAASLASGANPATVFMQQAPQVLQAMTMMGVSLKSVFLSLLGPIGLIGAATVGVGLGINKMVDSIYNGDVQKMGAQILERQRQNLRRRVEERKRETAEMERQAELARQINEATMKSFSRSASSASRMRIAEAKTPGEAMKIEEADLRGAVLTTGMLAKDLAQFRYGKDKIKAQEALDAESDWFDARTNLANFLKSGSPLDTSKPEENQSSSSSQLGITDNQRVGAYIGGPQFTMIDLQRKHLTVAQQHLALVKGLKNVGRGVHFGGTS